MKKIIVVFLIAIGAHAQVGIGTTTPEATLDVVASEKSNTVSGLLIPRLSRAELQAITATIEESTLVYVTTVNGTQTGTVRNVDAVGFYYYSNAGKRWVKLVQPQQTTVQPPYGDLKYGMQTQDHDGWYLLDRVRAVNDLPPTAQVVARELGFTTNLYDMRDRTFSQAQDRAIGVTGGQGDASIELVQDNLPAFSVSATTTTNGNHSHTLNNANNLYTDIEYKSITLTGTTTYLYRLAQGATKPILSMNSAGQHSHSITVNSGGKGTVIAINTRDATLSLNTFIYLGL